VKDQRDYRGYLADIRDAALKVTNFVRDMTEIPWRQISGMRDKLTHDYFGVDAEVVQKTA
jgi:uncharacterized protein with HEPN domain